MLVLDQLAKKISNHSLKKTNSKINVTFDRTQACDFHDGKGRIKREKQSIGGSF